MYGDVPPVMINDKIPSKDVGLVGFLTSHLISIGNIVTTSHSFFSVRTGIPAGVCVVVGVGVDVKVGEGVNDGVIDGVGVGDAVGVVVGVGQRTLVGEFIIVTPT